MRLNHAGINLGRKKAAAAYCPQVAFSVPRDVSALCLRRHAGKLTGSKDRQNRKICSVPIERRLFVAGGFRGAFPDDVHAPVQWTR